jgi:NAD+ diphosphatase
MNGVLDAVDRIPTEPITIYIIMNQPNPAIESQIADLASRYGTPLRYIAPLTGWPFDPIDRMDRYGEVCMVIRRPHGKLLTSIKTFYPPGCYRLPTGGVSHGERIEQALLREVAEETSLTVEIQRFLAVIEYQPTQPSLTGLSFTTFAFLLQETGGILAVNDPNERTADFREILPSELDDMATHLAGIEDRIDQEIGGSWQDWGRFRAVVHRVVGETLKHVSM